MRLITDVIAYTYGELPKWNPTNVCSYHLQEAGATPVQELAYALATAVAVLDAIRDGGQVPEADFGRAVGRISFFVNAGIRFVTELCKMRAFVELWDEICRERYGIAEEKYRLFRYGVQVNSLGLTEQQPENNVYRILLEMLAVTLSRNARARAVQLPAWNEALGLPRPWDQQWSLRMQQILAYETDLLEYPDLFDGSKAVADKVDALKAEARAELARIDDMGGALVAVETGYMKSRLVESAAIRIGAIASGAQKVVGVNSLHRDRTLAAHHRRGRRLPGRRPARPRPSRSSACRRTAPPATPAPSPPPWPSSRPPPAKAATSCRPRSPAPMPASPPASGASACARCSASTAPPPASPARASPPPTCSPRSASKVDAAHARLGRRLKMLVGKPGLDGHSNGAEQIAVAARDSGIEVVYEGIRLTPARIANAALEEGVHIVGLSILSGSHMPLVKEVLRRMRELGIGEIPVVVGGIIPPEDAKELLAAGVARVYTPKDYEIQDIMSDLVDIAGGVRAGGVSACAGRVRNASVLNGPAVQIHFRAITEFTDHTLALLRRMAAKLCLLQSSGRSARSAATGIGRFTRRGLTLGGDETFDGKVARIDRRHDGRS